MPADVVAPGTRVLQWAQEHGEVGGVHASHRQLTEALRAAGCTVAYVDTGNARRAARSMPLWWRRRSLHLFHITRLWRAVVLAPVFAILPGRTVVVLHSGSTLAQVERLGRVGGAALRLALRAYDEVWAVSDEIRQVLPASLQDRVRVVTPFVPSAPPAGPVPPRDPHAVAVATNAGLAHYHAELAVEAVRLVRDDAAEGWPDATLRVLAYGREGAELAALRAAVADLEWVTVSFDATSDEVGAVLASSGVFLRPTAWDGDSVIVREALAAGARVVASDRAPRPAGVELAALDAASMATALRRGGRPSDGAGLAVDTLAVAARRALAMLA
ncbi:Glycosyltransferase involved in cell wall bisynthesis [Pedococcus dokdonensis]|uniref:Glycosyltransferase involved in cell wall bisynthesis n=1 Tax=Pedococcus dokdonensis TaxID=443156 RepID=A0A1H0RHE1_9MICO|nr:glycosyltransferase [Pedococcus dokdonensis]SDP28820.1 Glycosyltransferase involved in cell wall bisynthesis [Pedococcus dokdonensis]